MGILKNLLVLGSAKFSNVIKGTVEHAQNGIYFGSCATAAATAAKVITLDDPVGFELKRGVMIAVKFTNTNTANNVTFNVQGTGAKSVSYAKNTAYAGTTSAIVGNSGYSIYYVYDGTYWCFVNNQNNYANNSDTYTSAYSSTAAGTAAKSASCSGYTATANTYVHIVFTQSNSAASALTLNINGKGAKPIYINGEASSSTNYTLPAGSYIAFYDGTNYQFRTDGKIPGKYPSLLLNTSVSSTESTQSIADLNNCSIFLIEYVAGQSNYVFLNSMTVSLNSLKSPTGVVIRNTRVGENMLDTDSVYINWVSGTTLSFVTTEGVQNRYVRITGLM